ncbi:MAG: beta-propeller fold lactonase family protein [Candidatus Nanopelagicales bacterium]|nr:beta-propeller fold lactonase family protein [Candidatus Nanopelagicales bacterium]
MAAGSGSKEPVLIGVQACGACHEGAEKGRQFSKWRLSAHAKAYASLALPEAREITRLSGLTEEPHQSRMCLGCHATGAEAEEWEKDPGFHLEDGLQCEACHGAGSEYAPEDIMKNREQAMMHGLKMPTKEDCLGCHRAKGSHDAVLKKAPFDLEAAWKAIAHPVPKPGDSPGAAAAPPAPASPFKLTGVMACAKCHTGPKFNFQFSHWRRSQHARAYAVLASPRAVELAREAGVEGDPQVSPRCLECHVTDPAPEAANRLASYDPRDGVQCESCHGPGSEYSPEAVMLDKNAARAKGLWEVNAKTCQPCHEKAHGKPFDYDLAVKQIAHPTRLPQTAGASEPAYKNPLNLALTPDGRELWVACEASASVVIVDTATRTKVVELAVGGQPNDVCFTPDGRTAFVSNRLDDGVSVVDVAARKVTATLETGDEPHGLLVDQAGRHLYVLNTSIDSISVFEVASLREVKRLSASRSPWSLAQSPDGKQILVTHALSRFIPDRSPSMSEVTVIDPEGVTVEDRRVVKAANLLQGVAWHPSGEFALITLLRTKNLVPMTRINHGWTITNGLGILWRDGTVDQVLLDQNHLYFPDPADVCITPDGRFALVTSSSTDRVAVVDVQKLVGLLLAASPEERQRVIPNHLGQSAAFVVAYLPVPACPKGITCSADGSTAYVASMLDDSVTVIDLRKQEVAGRVDLGGARELSQRRRGEKLFHHAGITFRRQFSCSTCHPDGHIDNVVYDIEDDGIGMGPIDNRTLRGVNDMAPYKWIGINPSLKRQCGPRLAVFITRGAAPRQGDLRADPQERRRSHPGGQPLRDLPPAPALHRRQGS